MAAYDPIAEIASFCNQCRSTGGGSVIDQQLSRAMAMAVSELERDGEIVVTSPSIEPLADRLAEAALNVVPSTSLSFGELVGVRSLILHAIANKQFFDWEMPTLTGFTAAEFKRIAEKLPRD
ncbi:hypothetical protein [Sphingomonas pruni]|uniref:hypothetical protein n=1 Tax=Sphingomonas pruni TaxID=40683 RepID=UPI001FE13632|nr:hypothetical protein [Sphingomonas pruni]